MDKKGQRDRRGRWVKGVSGNPKGRPLLLARIEHGDIELFKNETTRVNTPSGVVMMTREGAVLHRMYQAAMNGNVQAMVHLSRKFEKYRETMDSIMFSATNILEHYKTLKRPLTEAEERTFELISSFVHRKPQEAQTMHVPPKRYRKSRRQGGK
ncbi:MAG: DUF5681 domain-containing protein [Sphingomonadales bacterium]